MSYLKTSYNMIGGLSGSVASAASGGGFSPSDVAGLALWLDGNDPAGTGIQPTDGSSLATWVDKSSSANNFTQATGGLQPIFSKNIINGLAVISFNGSSYIRGTAIATVQYTMYVVAESLSGGPTTQAFFYNGNSGANGQGAMAITSPSHTLGALYGGVTWVEDGFQDVNNPHIYTLNWNGTNTHFFIDNVSTVVSGNASAPNNATGTATAGAVSSGGSQFNGYIGEILYYTNAVSNSDNTKIYNYLSTKWGV